jgi:hypothetical protein
VGLCCWEEVVDPIPSRSDAAWAELSGRTRAGDFVEVDDGDLDVYLEKLMTTTGEGAR